MVCGYEKKKKKKKKKRRCVMMMDGRIWVKTTSR